MGELVPTAVRSSKPARVTGSKPARNGWRLLAIAAVVGLAVGGPLALGYLTGAIRVPSNDGWAYARVALEWFTTGQLRLTGWEGATVVGHLVWGTAFLSLFGASHAALSWATAIAGAAGLLATFFIFDRLVGGWLAVFATAVVAAFPTFPGLAATYMTDIPSFAMQMICIAVGLAALASPPRRRELLVGLSLACGLTGFTVREAAFAAVLAVLAGYAVVLRAERRSLAPAVTAGLVCLGVAGAFVAWRHGLPGATLPIFLQPRPLDIVVGLGGSYFLLALSLSPILILAAPCRLALARSPAAVGAVGALTLLALVILRYRYGGDEPLGLLVGNYVTQEGALDQAVMLGSRPGVIPPGAWAAVTLLAFGSGVVLALLGVQWMQRLRGDRTRRRVSSDAPGGVAVSVVLGVFGLLTAGVSVFRICSGWPVFDRYLLGLTVAVAGILLLHRPPTRSRPVAFAAGAVTLGFALMSVVLTWNAGSYNAARWKAGESALGLGVTPRHVDAGFEWTGWHCRGVLRKPERPVAAHPRAWYLAAAFRSSGNCITVSSSRLADRSLVPLGQRTYSWLFGLGRAELWIYRNPRACRVRGAAVNPLASPG